VTTISAAYVWGTIIAALVLAVGGYLAVRGGLHLLRESREHRETLAGTRKYSATRFEASALDFGGAVFGTLAVLATLIIYPIAAWPPFDMKYHTYRLISGRVDAISSRFLGDGKSTTQNFVVEIAGQDYRCDDTRCALVTVGQTLTLNCIAEWEYAGTAGYDCNFVAVKP